MIVVVKVVSLFSLSHAHLTISFIIIYLFPLAMSVLNSPKDLFHKIHRLIKWSAKANSFQRTPSQLASSCLPVFKIPRAQGQHFLASKPSSLSHWSSKIAGTPSSKRALRLSIFETTSFQMFSAILISRFPPRLCSDVWLSNCSNIDGSNKRPKILGGENAWPVISARMRAENSGILASQLVGRGVLAR